ncbi:beta-conglycinin beta subunit 1 [Cajanus cajan]|uniref:Beta-conglycinin, alpha chain n=1 Tax=Cajanus cajan TaxID=3821 RepID=A0A151U6Q2_CAJCA|nr:beta-conglycinin beta subunit 1 [Cajanus cajan]KYP75005.1 Beta-conglycinin, alpha chain [Cajanus cajan]
MMRARFPLLLLLGLVFLASVSVSFGIAYWERDNLVHSKCLRSCNAENDAYRHEACHARCNLLKHDGAEAHQSHEETGHRERARQEGEKEEKKHHEEEGHPHPFPRPHQQKEHEHEHEQEGQSRPFPRRHQPHQEHQHQHEPEEEEGQGSESESQTHHNPFHFDSNMFHTFFKNQYGHIRVLPRFDQRSSKLQNLRDYRVVEFQSKPNTLLLPNHADAEFILLVLNGRAILNIVSPDDRESYDLHQGDAQRIPAGTTYYLINPDDKETLKVATLAMPVNEHANFENFYLSSTESQKSYLQAFSKNILEASFDTEFEEINEVLFGEEKHKHGEQSQQEGVIVKLSKEQIRELSKHAKSSSRKTISSEDKPFNLRSREPIYCNKFGKFFEITPEKNPQLRELDLFLSFVELNEGALFLPHYNSKAIVILVVNEGEANIELVGISEQHPRRFRAELSENDIFVIPAAFPVVLNATSNFNFYAFGVNAENNQRNFLAGEKDNVIMQIQRQVKELAFPGSAQDVEKLLKNQKDSFFVDAQPQQNDEGNKGRKGPLSSILGAFY